MTYLISGATGAVGRHLVNELIAAGASVRAVTRNPEAAKLPPQVELVTGDIGAAAPLPAAAFTGVTGVFVFPFEEGVDRFVAQAASAGCARLVVLSSLAAAGEHARDRGSASNVHHLAVERAATAVGLPTTVLRPGTFANNLLAWAQPIRLTGIVQGPYPRSAQAPVHEADIAAVAAAALLQEGNENEIYPMTGPQALSREEQLATIGRAIGRRLTFQEITPDEFTRQASAYIPAPIINMLLDYWSDTNREPETVRTTIEDVTGKPARTLATWAADHAAEFSG
jgi:uncharacterized protein YbjT (DUF2867 family)